MLSGVGADAGPDDDRVDDRARDRATDDDDDDDDDDDGVERTRGAHGIRRHAGEDAQELRGDGREARRRGERGEHERA